MGIITLTSDLGSNNYALAAYKAQCVHHFPQHQVLDLFHHDEIHDVESIAYQLIGALATFPPKTIHLIQLKYTDVRPELLIVELQQQYIIAPNNGILSLLHFLDYSAKVYQVLKEGQGMPSWQTAINMCTALIEGQLPSPAYETNQFIQTRPFNSELHFLDDKILCRVLHTDSVGHTVLNIQKTDFYDYMQDRAFYISFIGTKIFQLSPNYATTYNPNRIGALFNETGFLELFMVGGNLAELFNINKWKNNQFEIVIDHGTHREINFQSRG